MNNTDHTHEKFQKRVENRRVWETGEGIEFRLRCEGKLHTIMWWARGDVALMDHDKDDIKARSVLKELGGEQCPCLAFLAALKRRDWWNRRLREQRLRSCWMAAHDTREQRMRNRRDRDDPEYQRRDHREQIARDAFQDVERALKNSHDVRFTNHRIWFAPSGGATRGGVSYDQDYTRHPMMRISLMLNRRFMVWRSRGLGILDKRIVTGMREYAHERAVVETAELAESPLGYYFKPDVLHLTREPLGEWEAV